MILVTVGTHNHGFDRLVKAMDELAAELDEQVVIQYGSSTYIPVHAQGFQWTTSQKMQELTHQARIVVSHAAAGSILATFLEGKPLVVVPRLKEFGEVVDNHQLQLSAALDQSGRAVEVKTPSVSTLRDAIVRVEYLSQCNKGADLLISALQQRLGGWASIKPGLLEKSR